MLFVGCLDGSGHSVAPCKENDVKALMLRQSLDYMMYCVGGKFHVSARWGSKFVTIYKCGCDDNSKSLACGTAELDAKLRRFAKDFLKRNKPHQDLLFNTKNGWHVV